MLRGVRCGLRRVEPRDAICKHFDLLVVWRPCHFLISSNGQPARPAEKILRITISNSIQTAASMIDLVEFVTHPLSSMTAGIIVQNRQMVKAT
jgi:hypothetical protein